MFVLKLTPFQAIHTAIAQHPSAIINLAIGLDRTDKKSSPVIRRAASTPWWRISCLSAPDWRTTLWTSQQSPASREHERVFSLRYCQEHKSCNPQSSIVAFLDWPFQCNGSAIYLEMNYQIKSSHERKEQYRLGRVTKSSAPSTCHCVRSDL